MTTIYERAIKTWGKEPQMLQAIEEMSELIKEILKNINRKKDNIAEIIEETADVEIMLAQIKCCYNISQEVEDYKAGKLLKLSYHLDEWDKEHGNTAA